MLPENLKTIVPQTLMEMAVYVEGESDGVFNDNDYILFYAKGPNVWKYNATSKFFEENFNLYSEVAYYFINFDGAEGKRISDQSESVNSSTILVSEFDDYASHQVDKTNLIESGKKWMGEYFDNTTSYSFDFSFSNIITTSPVKIKSSVVVRSFISSGNNLEILVNNNTFKSFNSISAVSEHYSAQNVIEVNYLDSTTVSSSLISVNYKYSKPQSSSVAWLDYLTLNAKRNLYFTSGQMAFRNVSSIGVGNVSQFALSGVSSNVFIWDVTDPLNVKRQVNNFSGSTSNFSIETDSLKEFLAFDNTIFYSPSYVGTVANQNLLANVDKVYILVCPDEFYTESKALVDFHASFNNYSTAIVTTSQIYNEFSSGAQDITAIRNFMKYLYDNSSTPPKYLMLMGDGSYDYKDRISGNSNFVPTFQSDESYQPLSTFTSDDYYGMLNDSSLTIYNGSATVDIGIGRFPAKTAAEVKSFVNKVKAYAQSSVQIPVQNSINTPNLKGTFGDWKNTLMFVADDGNGDDSYSNSHLLQTELIVNVIEGIDSSFNVKKVYLDAYSKVSSPEGGTYPDVDQEIKLVMEKGVNVISYIGHGGEAGWADERILELTDINSWDNINKLPVFVTATCEFSRYDNPKRVSAGEYVILNENGGAIAMLTTVRLVFGGISNNIGFTNNFFEYVLPGESSSFNTLGDAVRLTKVKSNIGTNYNNRKFTLLGDPGLVMTHPLYKINTTSISDENGLKLDTIKALSKVKVSGQVVDRNGNVASDYNAVLFPTVYDKYKETFTLDNNETGIIDSFLIQSSVLFKGKATVTNGLFQFEFIVPKDINYIYGEGKISYYVANASQDGSDYYHGFKIGGTADDFVVDNVSPEINLFINDSNFVNGGITHENPILLANVSDASGINTVGNSIGHDIVAVLDNDYSNSFVLNDFYEANIDDYSSGIIKYPFSNLAPGKHTLNLKVWDIQNNSIESTIDFVVSNSSDLILSHVLNYPNPFTTKTDFYFEHNHPSSSMTVQIKIFTISGKIVKTLESTMPGSGSLKSNVVKWDGKDDYGDNLARGVYFYKLEVLTDDGLKASRTEKLVILN